MLTVLPLTFRALESAGVETRLCNRRGYEEELIKWADVIFTAGIHLRLTFYRAAHLLGERNMLTPNLKLRLAVSFPSYPGHQRNFEFDVNIFLSRSRWATL